MQVFVLQVPSNIPLLLWIAWSFQCWKHKLSLHVSQVSGTNQESKDTQKRNIYIKIISSASIKQFDQLIKYCVHHPNAWKLSHKLIPAQDCSPKRSELTDDVLSTQCIGQESDYVLLTAFHVATVWQYYLISFDNLFYAIKQTLQVHQLVWIKLMKKKVFQ